MCENCAGAGCMIFDTDILIWCFRGDRRALDFIGSEQERALSIVSFMELIQGARFALEVREIRRFVRENALRIVPLARP